MFAHACFVDGIQTKLAYFAEGSAVLAQFSRKWFSCSYFKIKHDLLLDSGFEQQLKGPAWAHSPTSEGNFTKVLKVLHSSTRLLHKPCNENLVKLVFD